MRLSYVIRRRRAIHPLFKAIFLLGFLITSAIALFLITELFLIPYFTEKPDPIQNGSVIFEENTTTLTKNSTRIVLKITEGETATVTNINIFESSNESNTLNPSKIILLFRISSQVTILFVLLMILTHLKTKQCQWS
ncbi:MAG: hypothetical protein ACW97W_08695 [Candidatus Hodarchaeales archaeon]|jgi:hypothetical protein